MEFTDPFRDCRTFANRMGSEKRNNPLLIEPSVSERGAFMRWEGARGRSAELWRKVAGPGD
jgi:hypothetical protein